MKFIIRNVSVKKHLKKNTYFCLVRIYISGVGGGSRVTKMAIICQRMVILLQLCTDMIGTLTLTFHLIPNTNHLEDIQDCYKIINFGRMPIYNLRF